MHGATYDKPDGRWVAGCRGWQRRLLLAERESAAARLYSGDTRNRLAHTVTACSGVSRGLVGYPIRRITCSDVIFQICVCGIMRYFAIFIVYCF